MAKEKHKSKDKKRKRDRDDDEEHRKRRAEKLVCAVFSFVPPPLPRPEVSHLCLSRLPSLGQSRLCIRRREAQMGHPCWSSLA